MRRLLIALLFPGLAAAADERVVAALEDPAGDDDGNGALLYPQRDDFQRGDLDLRSLRIVRTGKGYRFEAALANPIRDPADVAGEVGPESLAQFARRGFYAFNLDVYIDLDRVQGSGNAYTLPGRGIAIGPAWAWEKAVVITPRPELMRQQLIEAVAASEGATDTKEVERRLDATILFITDARVRKRTLSFEVPAAFLEGGRPDSEWAVTAFVTGAKTAVEANLKLLDGRRDALDGLTLGVMQPKTGRPRDSFGYSGTMAPPAAVDVLAPAAGEQKEMLAAGSLRGVAWSPAGATTAGGAVAPASSISRTPPAAEPPRGDVAARLRKLDALKAEGLVTPDEYATQRARILGDL